MPCNACATAVCNQYDSPTLCDHFHIVFDSDLLVKPIGQKRQGACHELGHSVGFPDAGHTGGCMAGGTHNAGILNTHEIDDIDAKW